MKQKNLVSFANKLRGQIQKLALWSKKVAKFVEGKYEINRVHFRRI